MWPKSWRRTKKTKMHGGYYRPVCEWLEDRTLPSTIFGSVWNDLIADGARAAGEPPIAAVSMVLRQGNIDVQQTQTNGSGAYSFANVVPGLYTVLALAPIGVPLLRDVTLGGSDVQGIDFGLQIAPATPANTDVTADSSVQQMPSVAVDPLDANHVVMTYMDYSLLNNGYAGIGVAVSHNAGVSWTRSNVPLPADFDQAAGQSVVRFDAAGQVLISFMAAKFVGKGVNGGDLKPGVIFDLTTDPATVPTNYLAKTVNRRIYGMQANNGVFLAISTDDGMHWNAPTPISSQRYDVTATTAPTPGGGIALGATVMVTPAAMPSALFVGKALIIDEGLASMERVTVTAFTGTTFTAKFNKAHSAGTIQISVPVFFDTIPDLAVDTNPTSPNYGNMYATWTRYYPATQFPGAPTATSGTEIMFAVSTDGGAHWTTQYQNVGGVQFSAVKDPRTGGTGANTTVAAEGSGTNTFSHVTVGPEGGVYVSMNAGGRFPIFYSADGGLTFRNLVPDDTDTMSNGYPFGVDSLQYTQIYPSGASTATFSPRATLFSNFFRTLSARSIAADPSRPGYVYAVEAVPILNTAGTTIDAGEITFSRSTDFGITWNPLFTVGVNTGNLGDLPPELQFRYRSAVNDDDATRFTGFDKTLADEVISGQALPQLAIDADGNIAIVWYDTRRDPNNKLVDVYSAVSTDGGQSFSANSRITTTNFNADTGAFADARTFRTTATSPTSIAAGATVVVTPVTMPTGLAANTSALIIDKGLPSEEQVTLTAVAATTFTAKFAKAHAANFTIDNVNFLIGDALGVAAAGGKVYAAWTGTNATVGDQDIFFSRYDLSQTTLGDRYEPNNSVAAAIDLGKVTTQRAVPQLSLAGADEDWFKVQAGAGGQFITSAAAAAFGSNIHLELWDSTGTHPVSNSVQTAITANGQVIGQQISINANANDIFYVHVFGSGVPTYALAVQSLTADLGTSVNGSQDRTIAAGAQDVYRLTTGVGGSLEFTLTPGNTAVGTLNLQVLSGDGQTVLATSDIDPAKNQTGTISVPVDQGQPVLVQVSSVTTTSVLVHNGSTNIAGAAPVTLGLGTNANTPGAAILFGTVATVADAALQSATIQGIGNKAQNVRVITLNSSGTGISNVAAVTVANGGSGYTSAPTVTFASPTSTGTTTLNSNVITGLPANLFAVGMPVTGAGIPANTVITAINSASSITLSNTATATASVALTIGTRATGTAVVTNGVVTSVIVTNIGAGYTAVPAVTFSAPPSGTTATGTSAMGHDFLLQPGTPITVMGLPLNGGFQIRALDLIGSGAYHLSFTNKDIFESSPKSMFVVAPATPASVVSADLNGDHRPDLILTSTQGSDQVQVMLANGDGTFQSPRAYDVGSGQAAISAREPVVLDVTGDNIPDILVPNYYSADVSVLIGNGDGTFAPQRRFDATFQANSVASGDFNGDGKPDLAVLNRVANSATVAILQGRDDGTFLPPTLVPVPQLKLGDAYPVRVGDLNGDHKDDLVVFGLNDTKFQVLLGKGDGTFDYSGTFSTTEVMFDAQLVDLNGDNKLDAVIGGGNTGSIIVLTGKGDGSFNDPQIYGTVPNIPGDNALVAGLAVADFGSSAGPGAPDGKLDVVVTTRYRKGSDTPQMSMLAGVAPDAQGRFLGAAQKLATLKEAGRISVADFNGDNVQDLAMTETGGVRIVYGKAPTVVSNTTPASARNLGTVVHYLSQPLAIVPGFTDAYFNLTVPTEAAAGAGAQVLDFSTLFQYTQGTGLNMEVLDAAGNVLASGSRFRITAAQGSVLTVHVFGKPAVGSVPAGVGVYTLDINVLPQVVDIEAQSFFPGVNGTLGGAVTSLVITFQGDRLDSATAEDARNYLVTNLDTGRIVPVIAPNGGKAVYYNPGANVDISTGRTFATAVRQTVTLIFDQPLPEGNYSVQLTNLKSADFNASEASQLASGFNGHALVKVNGGAISEDVSVNAPDLVSAPSERDLNGLTAGTSFMTQMANDLAAQLDALLKEFGDDPSITDRINELIRARCFPAWDSAGRAVSFLVLWLDPVSIGLADPGANRTVFNQQTNVTQNNIGRTYVEVGGNVEVIVTAAVSGTYRLNVGDVQPTARGGALILDGANVQIQSLTSGMRGGENAFQFQFAEIATTFATTILQAVVENNGVLASVVLNGVLAKSSDFAKSLITPELATAILAVVINPGQGSTDTYALGISNIVMDNLPATEAAVARWVERNILRAVDGFMPDIPLGNVADSIAEILMQVPALRLFRNLLDGVRPMANPDEMNECAGVGMPVAPENPLTVCVPDAPVNSVAAVVPERFPDAPAVQARAGWKGVIITAVLTVGGAYVAARGDKEREKPEQEIA